MSRVPAELHQAVDELTSLVADAETGIARQDLDQAVCQELLLKLAASGDAVRASSWLGRIRQHRVDVTPDCYEAVIAAQCAKGLPAQAESTLEVHAKELAVDGQRPSSAPYGALVQAYAKQGDLEKVQEHLSAMKSLGLSIDMPSYAAAIEAWAKRGGCDAARRILDEAVASGLHPSRGTFTAAVSAYTKESRLAEAEAIMTAMRAASVDPDADTWAWLLVASTSSTSRTRRKNSFTSPEAIFKQMLASGVAPNAFVLRALGRAVGLERREELCKEFHLDLSGVPNRRVRRKAPKNLVEFRQSPYVDGYWQPGDEEEATGTARVWLGDTDENIFQSSSLPDYWKGQKLFKPDKDCGTRRHRKPDGRKSAD